MPAERNSLRAHSDWTELDLWLQLANLHYWFRAKHSTARLLDSDAEGDNEPRRAVAEAGVVGQWR